MTNLSSVMKKRRGWFGAGLLVASLATMGCVELEEGRAIPPTMDCDEEPEEGREAYFCEGTYSTVSEHIEFTDVSYDFSGDMTIADLRDLISPFEFVWYGFAFEDSYPVEGDCDPGRSFGETIPESLLELPAIIEGVVTLHPRHFEKVTVCGTEERYYGSYIIQDETTGIQVLKDSRVAEFDVGDRVRIRVRALLKNFDTLAVLSFDQEEILTTPQTREPVYYQEIQRRFRDEDDLYEVRRIVGRVEQEATNQNFNEMRVRSETNPNVYWLVSLDRELGGRGVAPPQGALVQLTGPVIAGFGDMRMLIASLGKIEVLEEPSP